MDQPVAYRRTVRKASRLVECPRRACVVSAGAPLWAAPLVGAGQNSPTHLPWAPPANSAPATFSRATKEKTPAATVIARVAQKYPFPKKLLPRNAVNIRLAGLRN